jgi:hypothetical protein
VEARLDAIEHVDANVKFLIQNADQQAVGEFARGRSPCLNRLVLP